MSSGLQRAIPLGKAAAAADSREAMVSPRMGNTIRLDILPDEDGLRPTEGAKAELSGGGGAMLSMDELKDLFQNAYDATVITTPDGEILFDNIRAREFLFADGGTLIGKNITELVSGADAGTLQTVRETLESERFIRISAWCHGSGGDFFPSDIAVHRFKAGDSIHLCFYIRDITDRIRAEEAERTVERNRIMMESIGTVCHHLGQPSTIVLGSLELLKKLDASDAAGRDELVEMSLEAAGKIAELLKELNELRTYRSESYASDDAIVSIDGEE